jgi:uncharacterized membrane protein YdbT with pleckstrin-like domain
MSVADQIHPGEEVVYRAQVTRLSLAPQIVLLALVAAGGMLLWRTTDQPLVLPVTGVLALAVAAVLGFKYFVLRSYEYVLTNRRVVQQTGLFSKRSVDSQLDKVNNVEHVQTLWGRILGYGDVLVDTASETGTTRFARISRPLDFKRAILEARELYRSGHEGRPMMAAPSGAERMRQLKALLDDGLISPEEFEMKRRQLLQEL